MNKRSPKFQTRKSNVKNKVLREEKSLALSVNKNVDAVIRKNRSCFAHPKQRDFSQIIYPLSKSCSDLSERDEFDNRTTNGPECEQTPTAGNISKVENAGSQYNDDGNIAVTKYVETADGTRWQNIDNIDEIEKLIRQASRGFQYSPKMKDIHISENPKVKIIAAKFTKSKQNNIEIRRLDEKIACMEYEVYDQSRKGDIVTPVQRMRAFFSIKPIHADGTPVSSITELPSAIKNKFNIQDEDLKVLTRKEIEIIDDKIFENKSYLECLKRILKRKEIINKNSLDLRSLYRMARRERSSLASDEYNVHFFSKTQLEEVKELILKKCTSSFYGVSRRRVSSQMASPSMKKGTLDQGALSASLVNELLREDAEANVF